MSNSHIPTKELVDRGALQVQMEERMVRQLEFDQAEIQGCLVAIGLFLEITPMAFLEAPESIQEVLLDTGEITDDLAALMEPGPLGMRSMPNQIETSIEDTNTNPTVINGQIAFEVP